MRAWVALGALAALLWGVVVVGTVPLGQGIGCPRGDAGSPWALLGYVAAGGFLAPEAGAGARAQGERLAGRHLEIVVEAPARRLYLFADGRLVGSWPVAVGTRRTPTPLGHWRIAAKAVWGGAFGARWMQLSIPWGTYGIHGTNNPASIGTRASHGCIRMYNRDVVELYRLVPVGTPVTVRGQPTVRFGEVRRVIVPTLLGSDVVALQERLVALGYAAGPVTGVYGGRWVAAVRAFQAARGLPATGVVDAATYEALGLRPLADDPSLRPTAAGEAVAPSPPGTAFFPPGAP